MANQFETAHHLSDTIVHEITEAKTVRGGRHRLLVNGEPGDWVGWEQLASNGNYYAGTDWGEGPNLPPLFYATPIAFEEDVQHGQ